mgnify:CR=1 FL=1|tara:strand:+ start:2000 stop:2884 length:885 start_codon:yes stop_codon:yes gene_type:complete
MPIPLSDLTLSCIGAGRLGKTLCRLFAQHLSIGQIVNPSQTSSNRAVDFIGAGTAHTGYANLKSANIWLIATPDNHIAKASAALKSCGVLRDRDTVFHCSGSLNADILALDISPTASVHPIHSFANPDKSLFQFTGTACAVEGQRDACVLLERLFTEIGALPFTIQSQHKSLYHAATVMTCNYLVSLMALGEQMLNSAGVDGQTIGCNPLAPLIRQTVDNYLSTDAVSALTGPIARGDNNTVEAHLQALRGEPDLWQQVYCVLGNATVELAAQQGQASVDSLAVISNLLNSDNK